MNKYQEALENLKNWVIETMFDDDGFPNDEQCLSDLFPSEFAILQKLVYKKTPKKIAEKEIMCWLNGEPHYYGKCPNCNDR